MLQRRLVYGVPIANQSPMTLPVDSPLNGTEVPALLAGKASGHTMAVTVRTGRRRNGKPVGGRGG